MINNNFNTKKIYRCSRTSVNSTTDGDGVCSEGSSEHPEASTCDIIYATQKNVTINPSDEFVWNYVKCPPENGNILVFF